MKINNFSEKNFPVVKVRLYRKKSSILYGPEQIELVSSFRHLEIMLEANGKENIQLNRKDE